MPAVLTRRHVSLSHVIRNEPAPVISGVMPRWRQRFYTIAGGFMCLLFAGFALLAARPLLRPEANGPQRGLLIASSVYLAVALLSIGMQLWFHRRIISEFHFDGRSLRFRTLGISSMETREVSEIVGIRDWRGRSGRPRLPAGFPRWWKSLPRVLRFECNRCRGATAIPSARGELVQTCRSRRNGTLAFISSRSISTK